MRGRVPYAGPRQAREPSTSDSEVPRRGRRSGAAHRASAATSFGRRATARRVPGRSRGLAQRVAEHRQTVLGAGSDAGPEGLQPEGVDVHPAAYGGVGGVEQLEAAVDEEAVDAVGADPTADHVGSLQHDDVAPGLGQRLRAAQAGQPGTHDHHVCVHASTLVSRS